MTQYTLNCVIMIFLSVCSGAGALLMSHKMNTTGRRIVAILILTFLLVFVFFLRDSTWIVKVIPATDILCYGQLTPLLLALFVGFAWPLLSGKPWKKLLYFSIPIVLAIYTAYLPLFTQPIRTADRERNGCIIQSSPKSCGAAATAILLRQYGIEATEPEMADLCMTRVSGTFLHGMIRGLRIKTVKTPWAVTASTTQFSSLEEGQIQLPALLTVVLSRELALRDPRYQNEWGWAIDQEHVVVLLALENGKVKIADPSTGIEQWSKTTLREMWTGEVIYLFRR